MSSRAAQLAVELTEKGASTVAGGMDDVTASAKRMGDTVDAASRQAKTAGDRMDTAASGADELASKGSQAAGAMAGLGDLIGGPFGAAMQVGGVGLQAMADSGDLLNAALENSVVANARAKAGVIAKTVADKASAAATRVMTVAQKALNLAQRASPIGLIIAGVTLLVGLLVLAYKRSDTFRSIVNKAMAVAKAGVDKVVGAFKALGPTVQRIMQFVARVVGVYVKVYVTAFQLGLRAATAAWNGVRDVVSGVVGFVTTKVGNAKDDLVGAWNTIRRAGKAAFNALIAPVQHIIDLVQGLLDKISSIHLPHVDLPGFRPMLPGGGGRAPGGSSSSSSPSSSSPQKLISNVYNYVFNITLTGTASPSDADALMRAVDARLRSQSKRPVFS